MTCGLGHPNCKRAEKHQWPAGSVMVGRSYSRKWIVQPNGEWRRQAVEEKGE